MNRNESIRVSGNKIIDDPSEDTSEVVLKGTGLELLDTNRLDGSESKSLMVSDQDALKPSVNSTNVL